MTIAEWIALWGLLGFAGVGAWVVGSVVGDAMSALVARWLERRRRGA